MPARPSPEKPSRRFWFSWAALVRTRKAYRAGAEAGVAAVGAGAVDLTTTGYFAPAARPTSEAISASTSLVDFGCEYMNGLPIACAVSVVPVLLTLGALGLTGRHEWLRAHLLGLAGRLLVVRGRHGQHGLGHTVGRDDAP